MKIRIMKTTEHGSRPASGDELKYLEEREWLYINYYMSGPNASTGKAWIELNANAEREGFFIDED